MRNPIGPMAAALLLLGAGPLAAQPAEAPSAEIIEQGAALYAENCAACHGANLEGQPDWRTPGEDGIYPAPPHDRTGHTWHHADSMLFAYTKLGGEELMKRQGMEFSSGMPGFGDVMSDEEIRATLEFIKSTWPEREREMQAARTQALEEKRKNR